MMEAFSKPVIWMGSSLEDVRGFPAEARVIAGRELRRVQQGEVARDFKPMQTVGAGVFELRLHTKLEHRLMYVAKFAEAVYVLHAFEKRTRKTSQRDLQIAARRYAELIRQRQAAR